MDICCDAVIILGERYHKLALEKAEAETDPVRKAEILQIALDAGVSKIIPHIYSSIIDKVSGNTRPDDVRQLLALTRACVG